MKKWTTAALLLAALAGCQSKSPSQMNYSELVAYGKSLEERCKKQGIKKEFMDFCMKAEARSDEYERQSDFQNRQAMAMAMASAGASMQNAAATQMARPTYCTYTPTSTWVGGPVRQVTRNCY